MRVNSNILVVGVVLACIGVFASDAQARTVVSLNGEWQIAQGWMNEIPKAFEHRGPVPGLVDMAAPAFEKVGEKSDLREAFWYRRTFRLKEAVPAVALLKIHKARYGTRVYLNGKLVGDHEPCFTPGWFDVREHLRGPGEENELIVRVGAFRDALPESHPTGWDFEKIRYIPGIYDSVELILTGNPYVANVQTIPDLESSSVRVVVDVQNCGSKPADARVELAVKEAESAKAVGSARSEVVRIAAGAEEKVDLRVTIENCRPWSPEDPFLYELEARTGQDTYKTRFGMRSFRFDPETKMAVLNGTPRYLRGTNVCIYRFFEDPERGDKPWREEWARRLHHAFKDMHWHSIRYCIGFPPEIWYDVADEEGILIQDEFPIWHLGKWPPDLKSDQIAREYTEWMRERWNHPCVVIWDAQNESVTGETAKAIAAVRDLDLSNRPWDNGWSPPEGPNDPVESHPYLFSRIHFGGGDFRLADLASHSGAPNVRGKEQEGRPIILNEYGWLWVNRDGSLPTLTRKVYERLLGPDPSIAQLRETYARLLAALTEFWRAHRKAAVVMHFCGLGYSRPDGQTSDHFVDLENLTYEPNFQEYVRDAFSPVGLMLDFWAEDLPGGEVQELRVVVLNDLLEDWKGRVEVRITQGLEAVFRWSEACEVPSMGRKEVRFSVTIPERPGAYRLAAELRGPDGEPVQSLRDFEVLSAEGRAAKYGLAVGKRVEASSNAFVDGVAYPAQNAVDGDRSTRWSSEFSDPQWIEVDLGEATEISRVELLWEGAHGKAYSLEVSTDRENWKEIFKTDAGDGVVDDIRFDPTPARWVRLNGAKRGTKFGYSLWEMRVFPR